MFTIRGLSTHGLVLAGPRLWRKRFFRACVVCEGFEMSYGGLVLEGKGRKRRYEDRMGASRVSPESKANSSQDGGKCN